MNTLLVMVALYAAVVGCGPSSVFKGERNNEQKPLAARAGKIALDAASAAERKVASVTYGLKVKAKSGGAVCNGRVQLDVMGDLSMRFPEAKVACLSLTVDLAGLLGAQAGAGGFSTAAGAATHDGFVLSVKDIAGASFDPPRPLLLGPIIQDLAKFEGYDETTRHKLTSKREDGSPLVVDGSFRVRVRKTKASYTDTVEGKKIAFDDVLWWEMTSDFDAPAQLGLTFKKWEWYWNVRPLMIPGFRITGSLGDFIQGDGAQGAADATGELTFELFVIDYDLD